MRESIYLSVSGRTEGLNTYITAYGTDIGTKKKVNQDSLCVKIAVVKDKTVCMAVLCDGMGGLSKGELASATVVQGFLTGL